MERRAAASAWTPDSGIPLNGVSLDGIRATAYQQRDPEDKGYFQKNGFHEVYQNSHRAVQPPSMGMDAPVIDLAASLHR